MRRPLIGAFVAKYFYYYNGEAIAHEDKDLIDCSRGRRNGDWWCVRSIERYWIERYWIERYRDVATERHRSHASSEGADAEGQESGFD
jgi:hypothetical protein